MIRPHRSGKGKMRKNKTRSIPAFILLILAYVLSVFGILLCASLEWMHEKWGPVDFSTALFQLKTPMAGVDTNLVDTYINDIAVPAVTRALVGILLLCILTHLMKVTGYAVRIGIFKREITIRYTPILIAGTIGILVACWFRFPGLARKTGIPEYVDSIINRSSLYEEHYVVPSDDIMEFPEEKRNLVMIYIESLEASYASADEGGLMQESLIPNLTELVNDNINFSDNDGFGGATQTQGVGWTMAALLSTSSGVTFNLPVDTNDMQSYSVFLPGLRALGDILEDEGYRNYFVCGSDAGFGGRRAYFNTHGNYTIHDYLYAGQEGFIPEGYHNGLWGMEDVRLFEMAKADLTEIAGRGEPFNYTILTADTHPPEGYICDSCEPVEGEDSILTAIRCSDRTVTSFVDWLLDQDWISNTTIVLVGDHLLMRAGLFPESSEGIVHHVYNCFVNVYPGLEPVNANNRTFSNVDYFPTILASIGVRIDGDRLGLGTNLFSGRSTLLEELGEEEYNTEVLRYSEYYAGNFV